jgi:hypothetical protein
MWRKTTRFKLAIQNDSRKASFEDELLNSLPDVLLPSQFFESVGAQTFSCEQRLMLAILADAINVLGSADSSNLRKRKSFNEASSWVFASGITSSLSFDRVCDALGINAESLRRRLSELVSEQGGTLLRLRLKEAGRMQRPTVIRVRGSRRRARTKTGKAPQTPMLC